MERSFPNWAWISIALVSSPTRPHWVTSWPNGTFDIGGLLAGGDGEGAVTLRIKAETAFTWAEVDGSGTIERTKLNASRQRLMVEGARVRILLSGSGEYEEWGVSGLVRLDPGTSGLGLAFSVVPEWGETASGVRRMWESPITRGAESADEATGRVNARIAYGIGTTSSAGRGVLTPYTEVSLSGAGSRRASLGGRFAIGTSVTMSLEGVHGRPAFGAADHGVMLRADLSW